MAQSANSQAAANKNTNKEALAAQDDDSHASAASDSSAQLIARAILKIQRRQKHGRTGRPTPSKAAAMVEAAKSKAAASGIRLTEDNDVLEFLPNINNTADGSEDGSYVSGLTDAAVPELQSLPMPYKERRKPKQPPAPTNTDNNPNNDNDNDNNKHGKMQVPGAHIEPTGAAGGPSAKPITNTDGVQPPLRVSTPQSMPLLADKSRPRCCNIHAATTNSTSR